MNSQKLTYYRLLVLHVSKLPVVALYGIGFLIGLFIAITWFFLLFRPLQSQRQVLLSQIAQINAVADITQKIGCKETSIMTRLKNAQRERSEIFRQINHNAILVFLDNARINGFSCKSYTPQGCEQKKWYCNHVAKIELVGTYQTLESLLSLVAETAWWCQKLMIQRISVDTLLVQLDVSFIEETSK